MTRGYSRSTHTDRLHQLEKENFFCLFLFFSFFLFSLSMIHSHRMQTARGGGLRGVLSKQQNKKREHKIFIMMSGVKGGVKKAQVVNEWETVKTEYKIQNTFCIKYSIKRQHLHGTDRAGYLHTEEKGHREPIRARLCAVS